MIKEQHCIRVVGTKGVHTFTNNEGGFQVRLASFTRVDHDGRWARYELRDGQVELVDHWGFDLAGETQEQVQREAELTGMGFVPPSQGVLDTVLDEVRKRIEVRGA